MAAGRFVLLALLVGLMVGVPVIGRACVHPPGKSPQLAEVRVKQTGHQAIILHHDGQEELVLGVSYEADRTASSLSIILPVPSVPHDYGTASLQLFEAMDRWARLRLEAKKVKKRGAKQGADRRVGLELLDSHTVGPYTIQPVRATGARAAAELTAWMKREGFVPAPDDELQYFVDRGWTFLAVRIDPSKSELAAEGSLPPLRIAFASERPVYPLKLELNSTFDLRLYLITATALPESDFALARKLGFAVARGPRTTFLDVESHNPYSTMVGADGKERPRYRGLARRSKVDVDTFTLDEAPAELRSLMREARWAPEGPVHMRVVHGKWEGPLLADAPEDLSFPGVGKGQRLMGGEGLPERAPLPEEREAPAAVDPAAEPGRGCSCVAAPPSSRAVGPWPLLAIVGMARRRRRRHEGGRGR